MAESETVLLLVAATVLATIVAIVTVWKIARHQESRPSRESSNPARQPVGSPLEVDMLARFVRDEKGALRGETVRASAQEVVIKDGARYFVLPRAKLAATGSGPDLVAEGVGAPG